MAISCFQSVAVIHFDHITVAAFPASFSDYTVSRSDHLIAALSVDVHTGVELISSSTERAAAKTELIIDFPHVSPHRRDSRLIACSLDRAKLLFDLSILGIHLRET